MLLGLHLSTAGPKSWGVQCEAQTPILREKLCTQEMPPYCVSLHQRGFWQDHLSASPTHLDVAFLSLLVERAVQLAFCSFSARIIPYAVCCLPKNGESKIVQKYLFKKFLILFQINII